jgi:hypothetical protein
MFLRLIITSTSSNQREGFCYLLKQDVIWPWGRQYQKQTSGKGFSAFRALRMGGKNLLETRRHLQ